MCIHFDQENHGKKDCQYWSNNSLYNSLYPNYKKHKNYYEFQIGQLYPLQF
jgi:capsule polysaccharide modification protein KpsS